MSEKSTPLTDAAACPFNDLPSEEADDLVVPADFARSLETVMHQLERFAEHHDSCPADGRGLRSSICGCGLKQALAAFDKLREEGGAK